MKKCRESKVAIIVWVISLFSFEFFYICIKLAHCEILFDCNYILTMSGKLVFAGVSLVVAV